MGYWNIPIGCSLILQVGTCFPSLFQMEGYCLYPIQFLDIGEFAKVYGISLILFPKIFPTKSYYNEVDPTSTFTTLTSVEKRKNFHNFN